MHWSERLADRQVKLNVTAIMTLAQVREVLSALNPLTRQLMCRYSQAVSPIPESIRCH